jgi:hypothetical protein
VTDDLVKRILEQANAEGDIVCGDDGYYVYWPRRTGAYPSYHLRALADELDRRNEVWDKELDEYFDNLAKKQEPLGEDDMDKTIEDILAEEIQAEIDREILETVKMTCDGWVSVDYPDGIGFIEHCGIKDWVEENIKGPNKLIHTKWWFKDPKDKVLFLLRWGV